MSRKPISESVKKQLYAESMGRCMNPACRCDLFDSGKDIGEMAHIIPYCQTEDNSEENLIILCPNCHKKFDKQETIKEEEIRLWKKIRKEELEKFFNKEYKNFSELEKDVEPLLLENKCIYENYYLKNKKELWDEFECKIIVNNKKLREIFQKNMKLFPDNKEKSYSNKECIRSFIMHTIEFEKTRLSKEKIREVLFPLEINSIFGITPIEENMIPSVESLEALITELKKDKKFISINIGIVNPYIEIKEDGKIEKIFLEDAPRLRQFYFNYNAFCKTGVRLNCLNYVLKYLNSRKIKFNFIVDNNLREINIHDEKMIFIYTYCLSCMELKELLPEENSIIVNLHNWNGEGCISKEAYNLAKLMNIKLLTIEDFYGYINEIRSKR